ncbi:MAG: UPF0182 family protein [Longimicrobiales bacterium]
MRRLLGPLRGGRLVMAGLVGLGLIVALARIGVTVYTEILWHVESGYAGTFYTRVAWQWGARVLGGLAVGALVFANLRIVARTLAGIQIKRRFGNLEISEQLPASYVLWTMLGAAALLGAWFGAAVPASMGLQALMLLHGEPWGLTEPFLGRDVGFYVFWVPVLGSAITFGLVVIFLLFSLASAGYTATGALRLSRGRLMAQELARVHLGVLLGLFFILLGTRLWLARFLILMDGTSGVQGIFGFTDAQARLPGMQTLLVLCSAAGVTIAWAAWKNRGPLLVGSAVTAVLAALVIGQIYPAVVQRFQVEPNELERETPYIEENLAFTRAGFGLDALQRERFVYEGSEPVAWVEAAAAFAGLPVWNATSLLATFRQVEARFPYYDFADVTIHRYPVPAGDEVVALSVREVDPAGIQDPNWQNLHLRERYVAGMGAVASRAAERTPEGRPTMLLSGLPPVAAGQGPLQGQLTMERPQVFYGVRPQLHAVVKPGPDQFLAPDGTAGRPGVDFPEGIRLSSGLRTAALAWRFRDANLLFSGEVSRDSRFVYRRQVVERARAIAPFLRYPETPFPVLAEGRVIWVLEGFTGTRAFPLSSAHDLPLLRSVTWTRNSVKVTVDAVTGHVDFYRMPIPDPLADVYQRAFPGLFKPLEAMPEGVRRHLRYSRELFALQAQVLLQYHQETARAFHGQQDVWAHPNELAEGATPVPYRPEYGMRKLPGEERPRFSLTTAFVPAGRQNLTGLLVGRTGEAGEPELVLLDVLVEDQAPGPRQVEALVEQDPQISQQFSLWRTGGSEVWTGHLHVVPVGRRLLYMEPVFLAAEADAIPELRRFVVSDGMKVAMAEDLPGAIAALAGWDAAQAGAVPGGTGATSGWSRAALDLLDRAEERLRAADWGGFGEALRELRALLEGSGPGVAPPGR